MTHYYQGDLDWEDDLELSKDDQETADDLAIEIMGVLTDHKLDVALEAVFMCTEMLERIEKEQLMHRDTNGINGQEYLS